MRRDCKELGFTVVAKPESHHVEFVVYAIEGEYSDGSLCWHKAGSPSHPSPVDTLEEAEPYLSGDVKWDGCSNWFFDEQERCMLHGCSRGELTALGEIMAACWDWTAELLPNFEGTR